MDLMIPLVIQSEIPMYEQIYQYIRDEIKAGSLCAAQRLPSTRLLAENLHISRSTTQLAYEQLLSEGYIEAVPCKGYFVAGMDTMVEIRKESPGGFFQGDEIRHSEHEPEYLVDFSPRGIDLDSFPFGTWRKLSRNTLVDDNKNMFHSGDHQGEPSFRGAIRDYLHSARGVECDADQIIVGAGSEYLLMLLCQILGPGRRMAMENPTYLKAYQVFGSMGYEMLRVHMDESGMIPGELEAQGAEVAYVMPSHHYPTGIVMSVGRRQELLKWASGAENRYLVEDDYDSEFRYKGKPIPALQGMDRRGKVIYLGTFSKCIAPAIRVSYMVLPKQLLHIYRKKLGFYSSTVSRIDQNILYQFMSEGYFERHLNRMRSVYRSKHDLLMSEIRKLEPQFEMHGENAGLHILLTQKNGMPEQELIERAKQQGIRVYGMNSFLVSDMDASYSSTVILGYASLTPEKITQGCELLRKAWL